MKRRFLYPFLFVFILLTGQGCLSFSSSKKPVTSGPLGMFVSKDKGDNWQAIVTLPTAEAVKNIAGVSVYRLIEDSHDANTLYLLSRQQGMFFTYDNGTTWRQVSPPLATGFVYDLTIHPKDPCTMFATNGTQVFRSYDCNRSWQEVYRELRPGITISSLDFEAQSPFRIFLAEGNGDLLESLDAGEHWTINTRLGKQIIKVVSDRKEPAVIYIITRKDGLYRSINSGQSWESLAAGLKQFSGGLEYRRFFLHPKTEGVLYWISTYGILYSTDKGNNWSAFSLLTPPGSINIYAFAQNPENDQEFYYIGTIKDNTRSILYRTIDGGKNWTTKKLPSGQVPTVLRVHPEHPEWLYLGFTAPVQS